jgi:nitroreductase
MTRAAAPAHQGHLQSLAMDTDSAIRDRRSIKDFTLEAVDGDVVRELIELAQWAPNHNLTAPWRFRLIGPEATQALIDIAPEDKKKKMTLAPTRLLVSVVVAGDPTRREEDLLAVGAAIQNLLLAATARGIATFWQSPKVAGLAPSRFKLGIPQEEELVAVLNLGIKQSDRPIPARPSVDDVYSELA